MMPKKTKRQGMKMPKTVKLSEEQIDALFSKITDSTLDDEAAEFIKLAILGNAWLIQELERGKLTIAKLRKLFQIQGSEKAMHRKPINDPAAANNQKGTQTSKGHGRNGVEAYAGAKVVDVPHPELSPGDICPKEFCDGRLYEMTDPGVLIRVTGAPLASATQYRMQKLRCAICEVIYTAPLPDGVSDKKYDASFVAMLMINKYFMAIPLYRQDRLQKYLGIPLPASTQWELMAEHKPMLAAVYQALYQDAANGLALCYDDTSVKIQSEIKAARKAEKGQKNKYNCFTTGVVSIHKDHCTYLYMSDNHTAGKSIAKLITMRDEKLALPTIMSDALSANIPKDISEDLYTLCFCLVHARRQFYQLPDGYDDLADQVIGFIGNIYDHEASTKDFDAEKRLAYHQKNSAPIMQALKTFLEQQQLQFEPNSVPGKAIAYILNRFTELSQFLRHAHAPLDTNIVERALKLVIQVRKSSMFYKSLNSAALASYIQSAIYSAAQNDINPCAYMTALLANEQAVIERPQDWLPWHYQKTLKKNQEVCAKKALMA